MGETLVAALLVIVGFIVVVIGQPLVQFLGIVVIALGVGGALFADLRKPADSPQK
jgi:hypothetical protein